MSGFQSRNVGGHVTLRPGIFQGALTAGGSGNNSALTGAAVDRAGLEYPLSCVLATFAEATLQSGQTLTLTTKLQHSANNSDWADFATEAAAVVATGPSGGGAVTATHELDVDLSGANEYVRAVVTPDLSASGTDTAVVMAAICFGGEPELPAVA